MAAATNFRETKFIGVFILVAAFFGLSEPTTSFFFPQIGAQIFKTINFYFIVIVAFLALNQRYVATIPPVFTIMWKYLVAFPIFYLIFIFFFGNIQAIPIPRMDNVILETIISFSENLLLLYLIPPVWNWGNYAGASKTIGTLISNIRFHLPAVLVLTLLHAGNYALNATNFNTFYTSMAIAFFMFLGFVVVKEIFGFGTSEAAHASWNTVLIGLRGSVI